ncbi:hypothetical protein AVEN_58919-1 [Araneus ventricosus]|uniref:Uncharacterized protein n=1 Tax=Araneus ventricosus TaxID=182803 RepID=A0A4Y2EPA0_ARAVE|nr:hypothetical protein AVEN_58919-1 [Araneus ventricosus]
MYTFRRPRGNATRQNFVTLPVRHVAGNRGLYSIGLKMYTIVTENCQQRKFKPVGRDFDGDVVSQEFRDVKAEILSDRLSQSVTCYKLLASGISPKSTESVHTTLTSDIALSVTRHISRSGFGT